MINHTVKLFIVAVLMLMPCISFALTDRHNLGCNSCHGSTVNGQNNIANNDVRYNRNVCITCHYSGSLLTKKQFVINDFSNIYNNNGIVTQSSPQQTSHKWYGSDTVPQAGALPPIDPRGEGGLNKRGFPGALSCARCHSVHGTSGADSVNRPYLRMPNDADQLCRACHRTYDTTDQALGTHPVNVSYSSARYANDQVADVSKTSFRASPVINAVNPTGQVKLKNGGTVVCSTCHGVHNTDSRTSTFDPYSSTHTFGKLSSSKGYLLRVSAFGRAADGSDINICTNCHVAKNHNIKATRTKPPVQCNDCHSGHVEYDAAYPAELKNQFLVRRYLTYTTAGRKSKRILYRAGATKEYWNPTGTGACQVCHLPPGPLNTAMEDHGTGVTGKTTPNAGHQNCADCHNHGELTGSFSWGIGGACTTNCHGLPPTATTGAAVGYTKFDEATTPHKSHAAGGGSNANDFTCDTCHKNTPVINMDKTVYGEIFKVAQILPGLTATYTGSNCNFVYCHSTGRGTWKTTANPMVWGSNKQGTIIGKTSPVHECNFCHDDPNYSAGHGRHIAATGMGYGCVTCHSATVSNNTTLIPAAKIVGGTHTNAIKDVAYSGVGAAVGASCATINCHSNGKGAAPNTTPTWGTPTSGQCGACHWTKAIGPLATGSHTAHFAFIAGTEQQVCNNCHTYPSETGANHVNGTVEVNTGCVCHASPYGPTVVTPVWGTISTGCGQCHTGVGAFTGTGTSPTTGSHSKHMAIPATCSQCHAGAIAGVTGGNSHALGFVDVTNVGYPANVTKHTAGSGYWTCTNASGAGCHVSPFSTSAVTSPTWGVAAGCISCHTGVGAFTGTGSSPTTGSHTKHQPIAPACNVCHTGANAGISGGNFHPDGNIDVAVGYPANVTKHTAGSGYSACNNTTCHMNVYGTAAATSPTWGSSGLGCAACHNGVGAFTGAGASPTTGSHTKHQPSAACGICHSGATGTSGGDFHPDTNIDVVGVGYTANVTKHTAGSGYSTCNATTCHISPYGTASVTSPVWGTAGAGCVACHSGVGAFTGAGSYPTTGSHTKHQPVPTVTCGTCHAGAVAGSSGGNFHPDANIDVITALGYTANVTKHTAGSGYSTCNNTTCHVSPYGTASVTSPTWGTAGAGCAACHSGVGAFTGTGASPTTGSHTKHQPQAACGICHAGATGTSGGNFHTDSNIDVVGVGYTANVTKHTAGSGYSTCNATTCHISPYGTASVTSPIWGTAGAGCVACHSGVGAFTGAGSSPATGSHTKHLPLAGVACGTCHAGAVAGSSGGNFHTDTNVDVIGGYTANVTKHTAGSGYSTCTTTLCHGSNSPVWGANTANAFCTECHGSGTASITSANRDLVAPIVGTAGADTGKVSSNVKTGAHSTHLRFLNGFSNYSTVDYRCESCHGTLPVGTQFTHADGTSSPQGKFQKLASKWGAMTATYTGTTCNNTYCHNPAGTGGTLLSANTSTNVAPTWTNAAYIADGTRKTAANCNLCHKVPGTSGFTSNFDHGVLDITGVCNGCHGHDGDTQGPAGQRHIDGIKYGGGSTCNGCHGYPPMGTADLAGHGAGNYADALVENYIGGGGHHKTHLLPSVVIGQGFAPCVPCHPQTSATHHNISSIVSQANVDVNDPTDVGYRFDSTRAKRYYSSKCTNVSCHFTPTPVW